MQPFNLRKNYSTQEMIIKTDRVRTQRKMEQKRVILVLEEMKEWFFKDKF